MTASSLEGFRCLLRIQDLDTKLAGLESGLAELPGQRHAIAGAIEGSEQQIENSRQQIEEKERDERRLEIDLRQQETLIERLNGQSAQITSTHAYTALQHEIEHASEARSGFETRALELMEAIDGERGRLAAFETEHAALKARAPDQLGKIDARGAELESQRRGLLEVRAKECAGAETPLVELYERVARRHQPAVLVLMGSACPKCGFIVPAQQALEIQSAKAAYRCGGCQRILLASRVLTEAEVAD